MSRTVGVVVPCKDEVATIGSCLTALREQVPSPVRVVVVDNGSTDGSLAIARQLADEVLEVPAGPISRLRNLGAAALGDVDALGFVDADCEVQPGWVAAGLGRLDAVDLVGARAQAAPDAPWVARRWAAIEEARAHDDRVWSQHLMISRTTFERIGGFDENLPTGEDIDLSTRVAQAGGRVGLEPGMVAVHHGYPPDLRAFLRRERWHTRGLGWYSRMTPKSRLLVVAAAAWSVVGAALALRAATRGDWRWLAAWAAATLGGIPALGMVSGGRRGATLQDGVLMGIWAVVRVLRLPQELGAQRRLAARGLQLGGVPR